jgi:uncharacterized protein YbcI
MSAPDLDQPRHSNLNAELARAIVQVHSRGIGRGPTKAKVFRRDNLVVLLLQDALTRAERGLVDSGRRDVALEMRRHFNDSMRSDLVATVEELTGCQVLAFLSDSAVSPDVVAQMFVLDRPVGLD